MAFARTADASGLFVTHGWLIADDQNRERVDYRSRTALSDYGWAHFYRMPGYPGSVMCC